MCFLCKLYIHIYIFFSFNGSFFTNYFFFVFDKEPSILMGDPLFKYIYIYVINEFSINYISIDNTIERETK